jgi:hypothetical protein
MLLQLDRVALYSATALGVGAARYTFGMYEKHLGWFIENKKIRHRNEAHPP